MKVKLKNLGKIITGNTPKKSDKQNYASNDICFVKPSDISDYTITKINNTENYISNYATNSARLAPKGSVLVTCIGIIGKVAILENDSAFNQQINAIIPYKDKILSNYLAYNLFHKKKYMQQKANAPVVPIINKTQFEDLEIILHSLEEQKQIADTLDKVTNLIELRKKQLKKLDIFSKALFVEMFGDPVKNTKNFPSTKLINIIKLQRGYDLPIQNRIKGDIPVYGANGILDYHTEYKFKNGIITGRSGSIGNVYYCAGNFWPLNTTLFSTNIYNNNPIYLCYLLEKFSLKRFISGTSVPTLNRNIIHKEKIIDVPIELQNQFAERIERIDKIKSSIQDSLNKLETLKKSLMQEYFS